MLNEDGKKAADIQADDQSKGDGAPGGGPFEWTGEPRPNGDGLSAEVEAAEVEAAEVVAPAAEDEVPAADLPDVEPAPILAPRSGLVTADGSSRRPPEWVARKVETPRSHESLAVEPVAHETAAVEPAPPSVGAASIGAFRPWAGSASSAPKQSGLGAHRRVIATVGGGALIVALIAGAAVMAIQMSGAQPAAGATGEPSAATSRPTATPTPTPAPTASPTPSPSPTPAPGPVTASTALTPDRGSIVSADTFHDSHSGWAGAGSHTSATTFQYQAGGYAIGSLTGTMDHMVYGPYRTPKQQLSMELTATLTGAPSGAGMGVTCRRGTGPSQTTYALVVLNTGRFYVERYNGVPGSSSKPVILKRGASTATPGSTPLTIVGMCVNLGGGTTRLALFVGGQKIADLTDAATLTGTGWTGGIDMASGKTPSTLIATNWVERDLSK